MYAKPTFIIDNGNVFKVQLEARQQRLEQRKRRSASQYDQASPGPKERRRGEKAGHQAVQKPRRGRLEARSESLDRCPTRRRRQERRAQERSAQVPSQRDRAHDGGLLEGVDRRHEGQRSQVLAETLLGEPQDLRQRASEDGTIGLQQIDWMIEVLCSYKCCDMTFFVAVNYMDMYFQRTAIKHELNDLHLIGVASMYVATKYEEICPLRISVMQSKISHGKFTKEEIKTKETDILQALNFECSPVTILNFLEVGLETLKLREVLSEGLYNHLSKLSVYIAKMIMHEYALLSQYSQSQFSVACIYIGLKIIQQLEPSFKIDTYAFKLRSAFDISDNVFFECSQTCLDLAKNFETKYPSLTNLAKFHTFSMETSAQSAETDSTTQSESVASEAEN